MKTWAELNLMSKIYNFVGYSDFSSPVGDIDKIKTSIETTIQEFKNDRTCQKIVADMGGSGNAVAGKTVGTQNTMLSNWIRVLNQYQTNTGIDGLLNGGGAGVFTRVMNDEFGVSAKPLIDALVKTVQEVYQHFGASLSSKKASDIDKLQSELYQQEDVLRITLLDSDVLLNKLRETEIANAEVIYIRDVIISSIDTGNFVQTIQTETQNFITANRLSYTLAELENLMVEEIISQNNGPINVLNLTVLEIPAGGTVYQSANDTNTNLYYKYLADKKLRPSIYSNIGSVVSNSTRSLEQVQKEFNECSKKVAKSQETIEQQKIKLQKVLGENLNDMSNYDNKVLFADLIAELENVIDRNIVGLQVSKAWNISNDVFNKIIKTVGISNNTNWDAAGVGLAGANLANNIVVDRTNIIVVRDVLKYVLYAIIVPDANTFDLRDPTPASDFVVLHSNPRAEEKLVQLLMVYSLTAVGDAWDTNIIHDKLPLKYYNYFSSEFVIWPMRKFWNLAISEKIGEIPDDEVKVALNQPDVRRVLTYLNSDSSITEVEVKKVRMQKLLDYAGRARFNTRFIRKLFLITNTVRVVRLKMARELTFSRNVIRSSHTSVAPGVTEYGMDPFTPNQALGSKLPFELEEFNDEDSIM